MEKVIIIGNGISGITTARFVRKLSDKHITVISSETDHFFSRTALMYIYMGHMRFEDTKPYEDWFWKKNRINLEKGHVDNIDFGAKKLRLASGKEMDYDKLVLALGSKSNKFGWPGQDLKGVGGLYTFQDLEQMEAYSGDLKRAVIVGGGLIGIEMAEMFHSRHIPVTMIVREASYWDNILPQDESQMISSHILKNGIDLRLGVNLGEILGDDTGTAKAVTIKETGEEIPCGYVGLTAGVSPNVAWLKESGLEIGRGIKVNKHLQTNQPDVYAVGDCAEQTEVVAGRRPIEAIWYTGRMMGETVAYNICDKPIAYDPGLWFNSAKFIDIEYQVYGEVPSKLPDHLKTIFWKHKDNEKSIRINYHKEDYTVKGFNLFGIRYRHEVCEKWILEETGIEEVLANLGMANFDPEFYEEYDHEIIAEYNRVEGKKVQLKKKRGLSKALAFLSKKK